MNILRKITVITVMVIIASVSLFSYIDFFEKNQNMLVDNNSFVKDCTPQGPEAIIPSIGIENSTHTFDLRNCVWVMTDDKFLTDFEILDDVPDQQKLINSFDFSKLNSYSELKDDYFTRVIPSNLEDPENHYNYEYISKIYNHCLAQHNGEVVFTIGYHAFNSTHYIDNNLCKWIRHWDGYSHPFGYEPDYTEEWIDDFEIDYTEKFD